MTATLYTLSLSPPGHAARLALERKGVPHRAVNLMPGMHPVLVRALGFRGRTVPALRLDGGQFAVVATHECLVAILHRDMGSFLCHRPGTTRRRT